MISCFSNPTVLESALGRGDTTSISVDKTPSLTHTEFWGGVQPLERAITTIMINGGCVGLLKRHLERCAFPTEGIFPERTSIHQRLDDSANTLSDVESLASGPVIALEAEDGALSKVVVVNRERTVDGVSFRAGDDIGTGKSVHQLLIVDVDLLAFGVGYAEPEVRGLVTVVFA